MAIGTGVTQALPGNPGNEPLPLPPEGDRASDGPTGLGGWLVLVAIGLVVTPIRLTFVTLTMFAPLLADDTWALLTTPGSELYHPLWAPLLHMEIVGNLAFALAAVVLLVLFFRRSPRFPRWFIGYLAINLAFLLVDEVLGSAIPTVAADSSANNFSEIGRILIYALVWIPYMLCSRRVRNTFRRA